MFLLAFYRSTIGKKIIMGVTGLIGVGFVILHMAGNLQAFLGARKINSYGAAQNPTVFKIASDINVDQTTEVARMQKMLASLLFGTPAQ